MQPAPGTSHRVDDQRAEEGGDLVAGDRDLPGRWRVVRSVTGGQVRDVLQAKPPLGHAPSDLRTPGNLGLITLCGTLVVPRPFRPWRALAGRRR